MVVIIIISQYKQQNHFAVLIYYYDILYFSLFLKVYEKIKFMWQ